MARTHRRISHAGRRPSAQLSIDAVNPKVVEAEYAVRGKILDRAGEIERDMAENPDKWPFKEIVRCNIGNPQAPRTSSSCFCESSPLAGRSSEEQGLEAGAKSAPTRTGRLYEVVWAPTPTPKA